MRARTRRGDHFGRDARCARSAQAGGHDGTPRTSGNRTSGQSPRPTASPNPRHPSASPYSLLPIMLLCNMIVSHQTYGGPVSSVKEIRSVRNACALVEAVAERQPLGVSDLARLTGIEKSAAHRLAVTLHSAGWLDPTGDGRWQIAAGLGRLT